MNTELDTSWTQSWSCMIGDTSTLDLILWLLCSCFLIIESNMSISASYNQAHLELGGHITSPVSRSAPACQYLLQAHHGEWYKSRNLSIDNSRYISCQNKINFSRMILVVDCVPQKCVDVIWVDEVDFCKYSRHCGCAGLITWCWWTLIF